MFRRPIRLAAAMALMGLPLLVLAAAASVPVIAGVIAVFVVGEMLWIPTSQAVAARLAPAALRGTYFGVLSATTRSGVDVRAVRGAPGRGDVAGRERSGRMFAAVSAGRLCRGRRGDPCGSCR